MDTAVTVKLDPQMLTYLQGLQDAGAVDVYAYAFYFVTVPDPLHPGANKTVLVPGGAQALFNMGPVNGGAATLSLSNSQPIEGSSGGFTGGQIYVVIDQVAHGTPSGIASINVPSDITYPSASHTYSYQLFELALDNNPNDQGDISSVQTFGMTSEMVVTYSDGSDSRGFNSSATAILATLPADAMQAYDGTDSNTAFALGPGVQVPPQSPVVWTIDQWVARLQDLTLHPDELAKIEIAVSFGGTAATAQWPAQAPGYCTYHLQYVPHDQYGSNYFWLIPDSSYGYTGFDPLTGATVQGANMNWIRVSLEELANSIYLQSMNLEVHAGSKSGASPYVQKPAGDYPPQWGFTPNDASGDVAKYLVAGFDAGFWGAQGSGPGGTTVDLNKSYNWNVNYAYGGVAANGVTTIDNLSGLAMQTYDNWARLFMQESNAYGYSYSDLLAAGTTSPLISLWDAAAHQQASAVAITVFAPGQAPTGYQPIAPISLPESAISADAATAPFAHNAIDWSFSSASNLQAGAQNQLYGLGTNISAQLVIHNVAGSDLALTLDHGPGYYTLGPDGGNAWSVVGYNAPGGGQSLYSFYNLPLPQGAEVFHFTLILDPGGTNETRYEFYTSADPAAGFFQVAAADHGVTVTPPPAGTHDWSIGAGGTFSPALFGPQMAAGQSPSDAGVTITGGGSADWVNVYNSAGGMPLPTALADTISGGRGIDHLSGLGGNDTIIGGAGADFLYGNDGDDLLVASAKNDVNDWFDGGAGTDTLKLTGAGKVQLAGFDSYAAHIEVLVGDNRGAAVILTGSSNDDYFNLGALQQIGGVAALDAGYGNDFVLGSALNDKLFGNRGDDVINGGAGNDLIDGGMGSDLLSGGTGADTFVFRSNYGNDRIVDFEVAGDIVDLSGFPANFDWADLQRSMKQAGDDVVITLGSATLILEDVLAGDLGQDNFLFRTLPSPGMDAAKGDFFLG